LQSLLQQAGKILIQEKSTSALVRSSASAALVSLGIGQIDFATGLEWFRQLITHSTENSSNGTSSPVAQITTYGLVLAGLYECAPEDADTDALLEECYPLILQCLNRIYLENDPEEEGLLCLHDLSAGFFPASLMWEALDADDSPVAVQDPLINSIAVWSNECLIDIGTHLGQDVLELMQWNELMIYSVNEKLWDEERGIYQPYDLHRQRRLAGDNLLGFMPLVGEIPDQDRAEDMLGILRSDRFRPPAKPYLSCPTHSPADPAADLYKAGSGGVSVMANWLLSHGLERYGMYNAAEQLKKDALQLMSDHGFREAYHPVGGTPVVDSAAPDLTAAALCAYWLSTA
jgi:hypothetical protein